MWSFHHRFLPSVRTPFMDARHWPMFKFLLQSHSSMNQHLNAVHHSSHDDVYWMSDNSFFNCSSLSSIDIPTTVASIGNGSFSGCIHLNNFQNWLFCFRWMQKVVWNCNSICSWVNWCLRIQKLWIIDKNIDSNLIGVYRWMLVWRMPQFEETANSSISHFHWIKSAHWLPFTIKVIIAYTINSESCYRKRFSSDLSLCKCNYISKKLVVAKSVGHP